MNAGATAHDCCDAVVIRGARAGDERAIFGAHAAAFPTNAEARLVDALRSGGKVVVSLVAEVDGAVIGHVLFSPVSLGATRRSGLARWTASPASCGMPVSSRRWPRGKIGGRPSARIGDRRVSSPVRGAWTRWPQRGGKEE